MGKHTEKFERILAENRAENRVNQSAILDSFFDSTMSAAQTMQSAGMKIASLLHANQRELAALRRRVKDLESKIDVFNPK